MFTANSLPIGKALKTSLAFPHKSGVSTGREAEGFTAAFVVCAECMQLPALSQAQSLLPVSGCRILSPQALRTTLRVSHSFPLLSAMLGVELRALDEAPATELHPIQHSSLHLSSQTPSGFLPLFCNVYELKYILNTQHP